MRCPTLADLPPPPEGKTGWPWTEETSRVPESMPDGKLWPGISIVTPSYNQGQFIEETIRSVLLQGYPDLEYIIIDGGSTDESVEIIRKYERWITFWTSEPDSGQTNAINKGFKRSTGEIVAWLNSDDLYTAGALFTAAEAFAEQPRSAVVYGKIDTIDVDTLVLSHLDSREFDLEELFRGGYIPQPASFIKAEAIRKIGLLDEKFHYSMDYDLWIRLGQDGAIMKYIPKTLAFFRLHECSKTVSRQEAFWSEDFKLLDMALKRDTPDTSLAEIAYSHMFKLILLSHFSQRSHEVLRYTEERTMKSGEEEGFNHQLFQDLLRLINTDRLQVEDNFPLLDVLRKVYQTFEHEYNGEGNSYSIDIESKWVDEQLILLPNYLLDIGEDTESVRLYTKIIRMRPSLLRCPQVYRLPARCVARTNLISKIRGMQ